MCLLPPTRRADLFLLQNFYLFRKRNACETTEQNSRKLRSLFPVAKKNVNYLGLRHTKKERPKSSRSFFTLFVIYAIIFRRPRARLPGAQPSLFRNS